MRSSKLAFLLLIIVAAGIVCLVFFRFPTTASDATPTAANPISDQLTAEYQEHRQVLKDAAVTASHHVNELHKGVADTPDINKEYTQLLNLIDQYRNGEPLAGYPDVMLSQQPSASQDMTILTDEAVKTLDSRTKTWSKAVDQINNAATPDNETPEERIVRLQKNMNQTLDYRIGECSTTDLIWGCYTPGNSYYTITPDVLSESDCVLRTTLAHEHRHYEQWIEGLTTTQDEVWLEADARDHEWLGGGC